MWNPPRPADKLVRPSGELDSSIAHHLHNPIFNTSYLHGTETADDTNACIWLVMQNGFTKDKTLLSDHLARRKNSEEVDGIKDYSENILGCHEEYVNEVRTNMSATVEVVWGAPVRNKMIKVYKPKKNELQPFQLWGVCREAGNRARV